MPGPTNPSTPQTGRPGQTPTPERDRENTEQHGQTSRPDQERDASRNAGRPQDDRDPNSPPRSTQRPDEPVSGGFDLDDEAEGDEMETGASDPNKKPGASGDEARGTGQQLPGQRPRQV